MEKNKKNTTFDKGVTIPGLLFILGICAFTVLFPKPTEILLENIKNFIFVNLNWVYVWSVTIFVIFLVYLMFSKYGSIKLGDNDSTPEHSFFSWISMLFAAGMGIGLMYFAVAEPMSHYSDDAFAGDHYINQAKNAQLYTFFHWGIHAWAVYGLVGLSLAYFSYRYRLPLSLRSCLYPLLKDKINSGWGNAIDVFALCSTFFGITTTLGFGVVQINSGLKALDIVSDTSFISQVYIVAVLVSLAIFSAISGVGRGIKILSNINISAAIILMLFVLIAGPTVYIIGSFTEGLGNYISSFFTISFNTHVYDEKSLPWFYSWTILYWAWWISWAPFVGLFIARISKGRTIKSFIAAVLLLPTIFNLIWMSVFGSSAIWTDFHIAAGELSSLVNNPEALMFSFLEYLPFPLISKALVIMIVIIFFMTSADSGILVMDSIATKNSPSSPTWQKFFWGLLLAALALMLLKAGGLKALQTMTLITALPFAAIMLFMAAALMKGLFIDDRYYKRSFSVSTVPWSGKLWKERLKQIVTFKDKRSVEEFIIIKAEQAFTELQDEFALRGIQASIRSLSDPFSVELKISHDVVHNFIYGVKLESKLVSNNLVEEQNLPEFQNSRTYYPKTYFGDTRAGYDVQYFTKNELISDVLKHYERFIDITAEQSNEMFTSK